MMTERFDFFLFPPERAATARPHRTEQAERYLAERDRTIKIAPLPEILVRDMCDKVYHDKPES